MYCHSSLLPVGRSMHIHKSFDRSAGRAVAGILIVPMGPARGLRPLCPGIAGGGMGMGGDGAGRKRGEGALIRGGEGPWRWSRRRGVAAR